MADVRACVYIFLILVSCQSVVGKPFFGLLSYLLCDDYCDDDVTSTTTSSYEDWFDYDDCDCVPRRRRTTTPVPGMWPTGFNGQGMNIRIPNGVDLSMANVNGRWQMNMMPFNGVGPATPAPVGGATPAPAAGATPAPAPGATPPFGAATTLAATTAAPTTPAAGK